MFGQPVQQQPKLQFPTNYHLQQQQQQLQQHQTNPMAVPMSFPNQHNPNGANAAGTPNNSFAGTIDPNLLMTMNRMDMSQLQNMNPLFSPQSSAPPHAANHALLGRGGHGLGTAASMNPAIKKETASPDYLASEMDFGEPTSMLSPGSASPLNSPLNDFDGGDDFSTPAGNNATNGNNNGAGSFAKPAPLNIHQGGSFGESPGTGSLYSPGLESDFFPEGDFSLPKTRGLDMKFNRMHQNSVPSNPFHSMSMPVQRSDWFGGVGADGHPVGSYENPSGLQFAPGEMTMMDSLFEDGSDPKGNTRVLLLNEKRRRRRESHNAVERRRRDNINEKIQELSTLLPDTYVDTANKPNKGVILRKSVDYIRHLQQLVQSQSSRNQELEAQLHGKSTAGASGSGANSSQEMQGTPQLQQGFGMMRIVPNGSTGAEFQN